MKLKNLYRDLSDGCRWNDVKIVKSILEDQNTPYLDVTYSEGKLFDFAVQNNNKEILDILFKYFNTQLKNISDYQKQSLSKQKLTEILQNAIDSFDVSQEVLNTIDNYVTFKENSELTEEEVQNHSGESTQVTLEDEHSRLSESVLSQYTTEHARDIKDLLVYQAIKALQAVYSKSNDELAINIARDFGVHAGDGNASHVRVWHKGIQKVIDIYSSISAEVKGVHLSLNSIIKDIITSLDAINCNLDGHEQHVNLSGCEYEYQGEDI